MVPLEADAAPEASRLLTRAFFDDPLNVWLFPDERHRASVLPIVFEAVVRGSAGWGAAWTTSGENPRRGVVDAAGHPRNDGRGER